MLSRDAFNPLAFITTLGMSLSILKQGGPIKLGLKHFSNYPIAIDVTTIRRVVAMPQDSCIFLYSDTRPQMIISTKLKQERIIPNELLCIMQEFLPLSHARSSGITLTTLKLAMLANHGVSLISISFPSEKAF